MILEDLKQRRALARAAGLRVPVRVRNARRLRYPKASELKYTRDLISIPKAIAEAVEQVLIPNLQDLLDEADSETGIRRDNADSTLGRLMLRVGIVFRDLFAVDSERNAIENAAADINIKHKQEFNGQLRAAVGVLVIGREQFLQPVISDFISQNLELVKSLSGSELKKLETIVRAGIGSGLHASSIASQLKDSLEISERRARLIARDQVGKLFGQLNRYRQQSADIQKYIWSTAKDERVRFSHRELEGKIFSWDSPPDRGHPGTEIGCRCQAIPVFDEDLQE